MTDPVQYEQDTEDTVARPFADRVAAASARILAAAVALRAAGTLATEGPRVLPALTARLLAGTRPDMSARMRRAIQAGTRLGAGGQRAGTRLGAGGQRAGTRLGAGGQRAGTRSAGSARVPADRALKRVPADRALKRVPAEMDKRARNQLAQTVRLARALPMTSMGDARTVAAAGTRAGTDARATARWAANRAVSVGVAARARAEDDQLIWVSERGACLHCLALNGHVVALGGTFSHTITFAAHPLDAVDVPYPPRHPNCRCRVELYGGDLAFRHALEREAERAVLRGFSNYDSLPARMRASERLLRAGTDLPKTVVARARADLRQGSFSGRHNQLVKDVRKGRP